MGMDINGLNPKLKGKKPEFPDNYEELSTKEQSAYWDENDCFMRTNPGYSFTVNMWGWRPIASLCQHAIENSGLNFGEINWQFNDGDGLKTQEDCHLLANAMEYIIEEEENLQEDDDTFYVNYGSWEKLNGGTTLISETDTLNAIYPIGTVMFGSFVDDDGNVWKPKHGAYLKRIRNFIAFLRECGGFAIY
jgi:hypothetical protein